METEEGNVNLGMLGQILSGSAPLPAKPGGAAAPPAAPPAAPSAAPSEPPGELAAAPAAPRRPIMTAPLNSNEFTVAEPPPEIIGIEPGVRPVVAPPEPVAPKAAELPAPPETRTDPKAARAWEYVRKENREYKASNETLRKMLQDKEQELKNAAAQKTSREQELEARNQELESQVGRYSLRATKEFRQKYVEPVSMEYKKAVAAMTRAGITLQDAQATVQRLARESTTAEEIDAAIADLPRWAQGVVSTSMFNAQELVRQGLEAEQNWKQTHQALEADSLKQQEASFKKALVHDTTEAVTELAEKYGSFFFQSDPANNEWMRQREGIVLEAQHVLRDGSDREWARYVLEGAAAPYYRRWGEQLLEENRQLRADLEARDAAAPRIGDGGRMTPPPPPPEPKSKPMGLEEGLTSAFKDHGLQPGMLMVR